MKADPTRKRPMLAVVCAAAVLGSLLGPAQALAGGSTTAMPTSLPYGNVGVGASSMMSTQINFTSATSFGAEAIFGSNASEFSSDGGCSNHAFGGAGSCTIQVTFSPTSPGAKTATLSVPNNSANPNVMVSLTGTGVTQSLTLSPAMFDFGSVAPGMQSAPQTFTATSDGTGTVTVGGVTIAGANASQFQRTGGTCGMPPFQLMPTSSCTVNIAFAPTTFGADAAALQFTSDAAGSPDAAALSGMAPTPPVVTPLLPIAPTTPTTPPKRCKKGFKLKRGKCVRKKKKKN